MSIYSSMNTKVPRGEILSLTTDVVIGCLRLEAASPSNKITYWPGLLSEWEQQILTVDVEGEGVPSRKLSDL